MLSAFSSLLLSLSRDSLIALPTYAAACFCLGLVPAEKISEKKNERAGLSTAKEKSIEISCCHGTVEIRRREAAPFPLSPFYYGEREDFTRPPEDDLSSRRESSVA